jgi:O-antigen/teichoic acid export membrane protein
LAEPVTKNSATTVAPSPAHTIVHGYVWTISARLLSLGASAVAAILLPRWLGVEQYGDFSSAIASLSFFLIFADFGLGPSAARYIAEHRSADKAQVLTIALEAFRLKTAFGLLAAIVAWILAPVLAARMSSLSNSVFVFHIGAAWVFFMSFGDFNVLLLQGLHLFDKMALASATSNVLKSLFSVLLVWVGLGVTGAIAGQTAGIALAVVLGGALILSAVRADLKKRPRDQSFARQLLGYSLPMVLIGFSFYVYTQADVFLIRTFLGSTQAGYYSLPLRLITLLALPANALGMVVTPFLASMSDRREKGSLLIDSIRYVLLFSMPAAIVLFSTAPILIDLVFGPEFLPAVFVMRVYVVFFVLFCLSAVLSLSLNFLGLAKLRAWIVVSVSIVKVLLNIVLIPRYGIEAAALATLITYACVIVGYIATSFQACQVPWADLGMVFLRLLPGSIAASIFLAITVPLIPGLVWLIAISIVAALIFLSAAWLGGGITIQELRHLASNFRARAGLAVVKADHLD